MASELSDPHDPVFKIVERPATVMRPRMGQRKWDPTTFLDTAQTGKAVEIPLNGVPVAVWRSRLSSAANLRGLRACAHLVDGVLLAWCTPREGLSWRR